MNIIIVGCGKVGATIAKQLDAEGHDIVVIDKDPGPIVAKSMPKIRNYAAFLYIIYIGIFALSMIIVAADNFDFTTTFTSVAATLNNTGPGLGDVGTVGNYSAFSPISKLVLSFDMLAGRLELFPLLILFSPSAWKKS